MKAKNVTLCDECKDRLAGQPCYLCNKDVCRGCTHYARLYTSGEDLIRIYNATESNENVVQVPLCRTCAKGIEITSAKYKTSSRNDENGKPIYEYDEARLKLVRDIVKMLYKFSVMKKV